MSFDFDLTFVLQMLLFAALIVVLKPLLFEPVLRVFEERERRTEGARASARQMQEEAGELLRRYEGELAKVHEVARQGRDRARAETARLEGELMLEAGDAVHRIVEQGRERLESRAFEDCLFAGPGVGTPGTQRRRSRPGQEAALMQGHLAGQAGGVAGGDAHAKGHHPEINWYRGMIGVKPGVDPNLLWRAPGTPAPFAALLLNTLLLFGLIVKFARRPVARGLAERRQRITRGIDDASAMKEEARKQLETYRHKLENLGAEIERVQKEMRDTAEAERRRTLEEAAARRVRLEQEARVLIERELEALREQLTRETARAALRSARELLKVNVSADDHRRLWDQHLSTLRPGAPLAASGGRGGSS